MDELDDFQFEKPQINPDDIPGRRELVDFFKRQSLNKYLECFPKSFALPYFRTMSEDDFMEYGIVEDSDIQLLLEAVNKAQLEYESQEPEVNIPCNCLYNMSQKLLTWNQIEKSHFR